MIRTSVLALLGLTFLFALENVQSKGGLCPDSDYQDWGAWSDCTGERVCPMGPECDPPCVVQPPRRQGKVRTRMPTAGNESCDYREQVTCDDLPSCDCDLTEWGDWGDCSETECEKRGQQRRIYETRGSCRLNNVQDRRSCYTSSCCEWDPWSSFTACSETCGGGTRYRERYLANDCDDKDEFQSELETEACNTEVCDPCMWEAWSPYTPCSSSCGVGSTYRTRHRRDPSRCSMSPLYETRTAVCQQRPCEYPLDQGHFVGCLRYNRATHRFSFKEDNCVDYRLFHKGRHVGPVPTGMNYIAEQVMLPEPCCGPHHLPRRPDRGRPRSLSPGHRVTPPAPHRNFYREGLPCMCEQTETCATKVCPPNDVCVHEECREAFIQETYCEIDPSHHIYTSRPGDEGDEPPERRLATGEHSRPSHLNLGLYPTSGCNQWTQKVSRYDQHRRPAPHRSTYRPLANTSVCLLPKCCDLTVKPVTDPNQCPDGYRLAFKTNKTYRCFAGAFCTGVE